MTALRGFPLAPQAHSFSEAKNGLVAIIPAVLLLTPPGIFSTAATSVAMPSPPSASVAETEL